MLVRYDDLPRARRALRRAKLHPAGSLWLGQPPADAPDLDRQLRVEEPAAWTRSTSDEERNQRVILTFAGARIRARVAGSDTFPGGW